MDKPEPSELTSYIEADWKLIPLHRHDRRDDSGAERGKTPLHTNWTTRPYDSRAQVAHMEDGGNVGVRLDAGHLVLDVDPRNGGDSGFARLCRDIGLDADQYPTVETGSGGWHVYMLKPPELTLRERLPEYEGVEFKSAGRQVVAAGSVHPNGRRYEWDFLRPSLKEVPSAPEALLDLARRPAGAEASDGGEHSAEEVARMLDALEPGDFRDHDDWLRLMQACHHASGGEARDEFVSWSTGDPEYADHDEIVGRRWDSLRADGKGERVTHRTLYKILSDAGRADAIPPRADAADDFGGENELTEADLPEGGLDAAPPAPADAPKPLDNNAPMLVATEMLRGKRLLRSNGDWFKYDRERNHYRRVEDERFKAWCWRWADGRPYIDRRGAEPTRKSLVATKKVIADVEEAARSLRQGPSESPRWLAERPDDPPASELLVCANGLLHLPTRELLPPTPRLFAVNGSPVRYDADAPEPSDWLRFMREMFPDEPDCVEALQEATGYFLTQDTSLQKIVQLVGPTRAGKGVYTRVLQSLIGEGNYTSPTAKKLSGEFGLQPLIGKQLAVISDMRIGRGTDVGSLTETMLTVSGEDSVSVPRKYKPNWEGKLGARFLIVSNEVLQLRDTSNALGARMIVIVTRQSFLGREDEGLTRRLRDELPGILNWALDGLDRLRERGHFVQPRSCRAEVMQMHKLTSPVKWFLDHELVKGPGLRVRKDALWEAFQDWLHEEGLNYGGGKEHFFKDLNSAGGRFGQTRPSENGGRVAYVTDLDLRSEVLDRKHREAVDDFEGVED